MTQIETLSFGVEVETKLWLTGDGSDLLDDRGRPVSPARGRTAQQLLDAREALGEDVTPLTHEGLPPDLDFLWHWGEPGYDGPAMSTGVAPGAGSGQAGSSGQSGASGQSDGATTNQNNAPPAGQDPAHTGGHPAPADPDSVIPPGGLGQGEHEDCGPEGDEAGDGGGAKWDEPEEGQSSRLFVGNYEERNGETWVVRPGWGAARLEDVEEADPRIKTSAQWDGWFASYESVGPEAASQFLIISSVIHRNTPGGYDNWQRQLNLAQEQHAKTHSRNTAFARGEVFDEFYDFSEVGTQDLRDWLAFDDAWGSERISFGSADFYGVAGQISSRTKIAGTKIARGYYNGFPDGFYTSLFAIGAANHRFVLIDDIGYGFYSGSAGGLVRSDDATVYLEGRKGWTSTSRPLIIRGDFLDPKQFKIDMREIIFSRAESPGEYNTLANNCFHFAHDVLDEAYSRGMDDYREAIIRELNKRR